MDVLNHVLNMLLLTLTPYLIKTTRIDKFGSMFSYVHMRVLTTGSPPLVCNPTGSPSVVIGHRINAHSGLASAFSLSSKSCISSFK